MPDLEHDNHLDTTDEEIASALQDANASHAARELTPAELRSIVESTPPERLREVLERAVADRPTQPTAAEVGGYSNTGLASPHNNTGR